LASIPVCLGALPVTAVLLASRLVPATPIAVVPIVGILVGGAMTATTLAGRRTLEGLRNRRGEVEAALSLGLPDRDARLLIIRDDAALALLPGLDQTRTVGLVTLPGAFVGMLLGGATPLQAAAAAAGPGGVAARASRRRRVHARARRSLRLRLNSQALTLGCGVWFAVR
jgi:putative ABC transport system permease protein